MPWLKDTDGQVKLKIKDYFSQSIFKKSCVLLNNPQKTPQNFKKNLFFKIISIDLFF